MKPVTSIHPCMGIERFMVYLHDDFDGMGMVFMIARFDELLDVERLHGAMAKMQQRHAKLRCKLGTGPNGLPCFETLDNPPPIPIDVRHSAENDAWVTALLHPMPAPFAPGTAPLARFILLQNDECKQSDLIGIVHHVIGDGVAAWSFLCELLKFYTCPETPIESAPDGFGISPPGGGRLRYLRSVFHVLTQAVTHKLLSYVYRPVMPPEEVASPGALRRWRLNAEDTAALVKRCRDERTTVFAALGAAVVAALSRQFGWNGRRSVCQVPINARPLMQPPVGPEVMGAYISGSRFFVKPSRSNNFWERARKFHRQFNWSVRHLKRFDLHHLLSSLPARVRPKKLGKRTAAFALNNYGRMPSIVEQNGPRLIEYSAFGKQHISGTPLTILAVTLGDELNVTVRAERLSDATVSQLCDAMQRELRQAIGAL